MRKRRRLSIDTKIIHELNAEGVIEEFERIVAEDQDNLIEITNLFDEYSMDELRGAINAVGLQIILLDRKELKYTGDLNSLLISLLQERRKRTVNKLLATMDLSGLQEGFEVSAAIKTATT